MSPSDDDLELRTFDSLRSELLSGSDALLGQAKAECRRRLADVVPFVVIGSAMGRTLARTESVDPLASVLAQEALALLRSSEADVLAAYVCLEVAAARATTAYGYAFRRYRDWLMRNVLAIARVRGFAASVRDTTSAENRWRSTRSRFWAHARGDQLLLYNGKTRIAVLDLDRGMRDDFDA